MVYEVQTQPMKTFAWRSWYPRVALMKLRPQVFILRKNFNISFSWNSGPWFSSCASTSLFHFHESQSPGFHLCKLFTISFSWSSGPWFSSCASTSLFHCHETQGPGFHPVQALHYFIFMKLRPQVFILCKRMSHLIFMNLSLMFSARACTSPLNCHAGICQSSLNKPVAASAARLFMGCWLKVS